MSTTQYGLEQARIKLPALVAQANAGVASVISLRGTGKGLWGPSPAQTVNELRDEWGDV